MTSSKGVGEAYFDVDGDDELRPTAPLESMSSQQCITWRGDPIDTGSDCTIVVISNELKADTYYVHKSTICFGTRKSKYFASHFLRNSNVSSGSTTKKVPSIKIELDQRDANNFPILLDFMYKIEKEKNGGLTESNIKSLGKTDDRIVTSGTMETVLSSFSTPSMTSLQPSSSNDTGELESAILENEYVTTGNAVSLRYLARKFENDALTLIVNKFIQQDLNFTTGPVYLYKAWDYKDDRLMESAQRLCAENISQIDTKSLIKLPLNLFRIVIKSLESFEKENQELSLLLSNVVCQYLEQNPKLSNAELLLELTDPLLMPYISPDAAIGYTAIVKDLESEDTEKHWDSLVRLCRRCATAVVKEYGWSDFSVNTALNEYLVSNNKGTKITSGCGNNKPCSAAARIDSLLFATSFAAALEQAQDDYEDIISAHDQFRSLIKVFQESITVLEKAHRRQDERILKQQKELQEARDEIRKLKRQLHDVHNLNKRKEAASQSEQMKQQQNSILSDNKAEDLVCSKSEVSVPCNKSISSENSSQLKSKAGSIASAEDSARRNELHNLNSKQRDKESSPSKRSTYSRQSSQQHRTVVPSSPAPMARQRMQSNQQQQPQKLLNSNSRHGKPQKLSLEQNDPKLLMIDLDNLIMNQASSQQQKIKQPKQRLPVEAIHLQHQQSNEPMVNLCLASQQVIQQQRQSNPVHQRLNQLPQQQQQQQPAKKMYQVSLTKPSDDLYKYHPDLLEMSYSENATTTIDEGDDDNDTYDSLLELEMSFSTIGQDMISPTQVSLNVPNDKNEKRRRELVTKNEMRSKSLLV